MKQQQIIEAILAERKRQDEKWGVKNHSPFVWNAILTEEVGEVSHEILNNEPDSDGLQIELVQIAAVIFAWLEGIV